MVIDQRGSASTPVQTGYATDRWAIVAVIGGKFNLGQSTTSPDGFKNSLLATSLTSYILGSNDTYAIRQAIEGFNVADLGWGTANAKIVTVSFWVRSSLTGTFGGALTNGAGNRSYTFNYTINSANTWEYKTVTIAGDTTGTWLTDNSAGIELRIGLGSTGIYTQTAGSWGTANAVQPAGCVSVVGTNGATFYITGVQLEVGSSATGFEYRQYTTEVQLCQRYFQKTYNMGTKPGATGGYAAGIYAGAIYNVKGTTAGVNDVNITWQYKTSMRANPTITFYSPATGTAGNFTAGSVDNTASINGPIIGENNSLGYGTASAGGSANDCYFHMTASSEL